MRMLGDIDSVDRIPSSIKSVKSGEGDWWGSDIVSIGIMIPVRRSEKIAYNVFAVTGVNPLFDIALELDRIVLAAYP